MLTERVMLRALASNRLETGRGYHLEGRVRHLRFAPEDGRIEAEVLGTRHQIFHVRTLIRTASTGVTIEGTCTCLVRHNCAHVAATLYEALDASTTGRIRAHSDSSDEAVEHWMHELGSAVERAPAAIPARGAHLVYVIDVREMMFRREVTVQPFVVGDSHDGGTAAVQAFRVQHLSKSSSSFAMQEDRDIGRLLEFSGLIPGQSGRTSAHVALDLVLRMLCATGRAHWHTRESPPLRLGDPIVSEFSWRADADGRARPSIAGEGLVLLPTDPPWYVDPVRNVAGVVDLGVPPSVAGTLAAAPALSARQAERARALWNGPLAHMNPSQHRAEPVVDAQPPVPVAILRGGRRPAFAGTSSALRATLDLRFDYGGVLIEATDPSGDVRVGDASRRRRRDIEAAAVARLREIGFREHLFSAQDESGRTLFAYAFEAGEEYRWGRLLDVDLDVLREQGWRVEVDPSFDL
ncbi:MAG: SWIM zinc finger family protein, partial [Vulcanimicrobiaceae bacterium]